MLNELYDTALSLAKGKVSIRDWHKEYVPLRAPKLAFFIYLNQECEIASIERISAPEKVSELRTWESKGDLRPAQRGRPDQHVAWAGNEAPADAAVVLNKVTGRQ